MGLELVQGTNKNKLIKGVNRVPFCDWYWGQFDSVLTMKCVYYAEGMIKSTRYELIKMNIYLVSLKQNNIFLCINALVWGGGGVIYNCEISFEIN